jgi:hypothetical protein
MCPACRKRMIVRHDTERYTCGCGGSFIDVLIPMLENGTYIERMPSHREIREFVLKQLETMEESSCIINQEK